MNSADQWIQGRNACRVLWQCRQHAELCICVQIITPLIGRQNVYNVLAAVAVGVSLNVNLKVCILAT